MNITAEESEALKCINALYLQLPSEVADDVKRIILNLIRSKNEHAESIAKERAVEKIGDGRIIFEGETYVSEKSGRVIDASTFLAEKRKEGAE